MVRCAEYPRRRMTTTTTHHSPLTKRGILATMAERYYVNSPLQPGPVVLQGPEAHHLAVVCRIRLGDRVCLFNGNGHEYPAEVRSTGKKLVTLEIVAVEAPVRELGYRLEVASPLPKGDRGQFLIEKLTEIGVTRYLPLRTQRSVVHPGDVRLEKLQRYVVEASKQCGRNVLMQIDSVREWSEFCRDPGLPLLRLIGHPGAETVARPFRTDAIGAIGPEGGFTDEEIGDARLAGWQPVGLGPRVLRIETAAIVLATRASAGCP